MGEKKRVIEQAVVEDELVTIAHGGGETERLPADDGVYEGEVAEILEEGECVRMVPHGRGTFRWNNGDVYEGEWKFNQQFGKGKFTYKDGAYYQGEWDNDKQHGFGILVDCNGEYEGEFKDDKRCGKGKQVYKNKDVFLGTWLADKRHGKGTQRWADGAVYEGDWANDQMHGRGLYTFENGDSYEGDFYHDQKTGMGQYIWADSADQLVKYVGGFLNGRRHGEGIERYKNGDWQIGSWVEGVHNGKQVLHRRDPCKQEFNISAVTRASEEIKPEVPDQVWMRLQEANKKGEVLEVTMPKELEDELKKITPEEAAAQAEARKKQEEEVAAANAASKTARTTQNLTGSVGASGTGSVSGASFSAQNIDALLKEHEDDDDVNLQSWRLGNMLGQGSYGAVYAGLRRDGGMMAVKCIELGNIEEEEDVNALVNEIGVMKTLQHTNIVRYLGAKKDPHADILYIFLEYVPGGSLASMIKKFGNLDMETARRYTKQVCFAINFLHGRGIIHRDIKGDNILVTGDGIVKLADFGCSKNLIELQAKTHGVAAKSMVGTPYWMAPEVITNQDRGYTFTADIWSIGCTVVEMLTGKPPWPEFSSMWGAVFHIANSIGPPEGIPDDLPAPPKTFLDNCFQRDVNKRYTAEQLLQTSWMKE